MSVRTDKITALSKQKVYYSDITDNLDLNPNTGEPIILINQVVVAQSIQNLILTINGERFYHPDIGSIINALLFNPIDDLTTQKIQQTITNCLRNYEPRASNLGVLVIPFPEQNYYSVSISFSIINIPGQTFNTSLILNRIR